MQLEVTVQRSLSQLDHGIIALVLILYPWAPEEGDEDYISLSFGRFLLDPVSDVIWESNVRYV